MGTQRNGRKGRQPLGKPLPEATEETAVITQADIERAKQSWLKYAPERYRDLLGAEIEQGDEFS